MTTPTLRISRQQLAAFLKNDHDAIRQFETLFNTVANPDTTATATEPEIQIEVAGHEALARIERLERAFHLLELAPRALPASEAASFQVAYANLTNIGSIANASGVLQNDGSGTFSYSWTFGTKTVHSGGLNLASIAPLGAEGDCWLDSTQKALGVFGDGTQQMLVGCIFTATADGSNGSATTETSILGTGIGTKTLPGSFFVPGKTIRVRGLGTFTTAATPGTVTLKLKLGSLVVATSTATTPTVSKTNAFFEFEFLLTCRTSTTIQGGGALYMNAVVNTIGVPNTTTLTIVNATSYAVDVTSTNSVASGCVWTTKVTSIEVLN